MRLRSVVTAAVLPLAAVSLAACGSSTSPKSARTASMMPSPTDSMTMSMPMPPSPSPSSTTAAINGYGMTPAAVIDQQARTALASLKTVHLSGTVDGSSTPTTVDLRISKGGACQGTLTLAGQSVEIIGAGGTYYLKGSAAFWTAQANAATASKYGGKWVTGFPGGQFANFCDLNSLVRDTAKNSVAKDKPKVLGMSTVNGAPVAQLRVQDNSGSSILSIAVSSPHYPLRIVGSNGSGTLSFSDFNVPFTAAAPAGAIDLRSAGS